MNDWQGEQELVQQLLQLSVDGSTQVYERGGYHKPEDIMAYSANCTQRQKADFENHFGSIEAAKALNVVCAIAPQIQKPKGSLTGLVAVFDGLASSTIGLYLTQ